LQVFDLQVRLLYDSAQPRLDYDWYHNCYGMTTAPSSVGTKIWSEKAGETQGLGMPSIRAVVLLSFPFLGAALADVVSVVNPTFSAPLIGCNNYAYQSAAPCNSVGYPTQDFNGTPGTGWTFGPGAGDGLTNLNSAFNTPAGVTGAAPFSQMVFLQGQGSSVSQTITSGAASPWTINFYLGSRNASGTIDGSQTVNVLLDSNVIGTYTLGNGTPFTLESITTSTSLSEGTHTLTFQGVTPGDHTAFVSDITVNGGGATVHDPKFSTPAINCNDYAYQSSTACNGASYPTQNFSSSGWVFANAGDGLTAFGSAFNVPDFVLFSQAAFLQGDNSSVSQEITGNGTNWTVQFYLGSRFATGSYDGDQTVDVTLGGHQCGTYQLTSNTPFTLETCTVKGLGSGTYDLVFQGVNDGDHTAFLSDVSVVATPEPSSIAIVAAQFAGLGLLGFCVVLRCRRS
jgi:hypothetical protein